MTGEIKVKPSPTSRSTKHRVQRKQNPVVNTETMEQHQRTTGTPLNDTHRSSLLEVLPQTPVLVS